ncbi:MAG: AAA family ATPase [Chromatiales bacterium]|nr:AAA family ATPase [Chromatiales bacterium]
MHPVTLDPDAARVGAETFTTPQPAPEFIHEGFIPNDVGGIIGAGGVSKTTLALNIACGTILGGSLFGRRVLRPGGVLFVTAEDGLARMRYRLHGIGRDGYLTPDECEQIGAGLFIEDLSDRDPQLVKLDDRGNLEETPLVDALIAAYGPLGLSLVIMDPFVSFGPGERLVNDGEQSVIRAARRIRKGLSCPVLFLVHTGKANAREQRVDQYAFRGGSALADGLRFVYILDKADGVTLPVGIDARDAADGKVFRLTQAKITDAAPWAEPLWLIRTGFRFIDQPITRQSDDERQEAQVAAVVEFLRQEAKGNVRHSLTSLEAARDRIPGKLSRAGLRDTVHRATQTHRIVERDLPEGERVGARKTYLEPGA